MEWIKTSDKLPENKTKEEINSNYYLVITDNSYQIYRYDSNMSFWFGEDEYYYYESDDVDCYMLLPKLTE